MFKHITVCLILASALNCLFLQKINISEVACKKVEEITKDLKKLDQDRETFGEGVNKHIRTLEEQIAALKRKITDKGVELRKYNVKYQSTKRTKEEELMRQKKISLLIDCRDVAKQSFFFMTFDYLSVDIKIYIGLCGCWQKLVFSEQTEIPIL